MSLFPSSLTDGLRGVASGVFREGEIPRAFVAPGRVNLIGEHTDYNDGFVLPCALELSMLALIAPRPDGRATIASADCSPADEFDIAAPTRLEGDHWANYVRGVVAELAARGAEIGGFGLALASNVPVGSGLSSSAAIEVCVAYALNELFHLGIPRPELARLCQRVENHFVGVNCGIMDQFVIANAQVDHALFLDTRTFATQAVELRASEAAVVVCDTHKARTLAGSAYNTRRAECESAVAALRKDLPDITALRDVRPEQLSMLEGVVPDHVFRRARHVVTENDRVLRSVECLRAGEVAEFGRLMDASHESLRVDYEVSCTELDTMVDVARSVEGVLGARMTGAGFGGCAVVLVDPRQAETLERTVLEQYPARTGNPASVYRSSAAAGVREIAPATLA